MGANVSFELCTLERKGQISGLFAVLGLSSGSFVNCLKTIIVQIWTRLVQYSKAEY